jgi:hypothetical protein
MEAPQIAKTALPEGFFVFASADSQLASQPDQVKRRTIEETPLYFKGRQPPFAPVNPHDKLGSLRNILDVDLFELQAIPMKKLFSPPAVRAPTRRIHSNLVTHNRFSAPPARSADHMHKSSVNPLASHGQLQPN